MSDAPIITNLQPDTDTSALRGWINNHLRVHFQRWSGAIGAPWTEGAINAHIARHGLIKRDLDELIRAADSSRCFVRIARASPDGAALGVVFAEHGRDRYFKIKMGVLSWVYVAESARGQRIGTLLMVAADDWMARTGVAAREVFVMNDNEAAVRLYTSRGYRPTDYRMLGPPTGTPEPEPEPEFESKLEPTNGH